MKPTREILWHCPMNYRPVVIRKPQKRLYHPSHPDIIVVHEARGLPPSGFINSKILPLVFLL